MATIKELQEKIAKLEKGINSKATSTTAKAKMRTQVKNFKSDIADLKAKSKPTSSKVSKAKEISKEIKRKYSKARPFGKSDIYQDAQRPAKPIGRRTSAEGNTYYEYRENRTDRKQPPKRYPRLEDGGRLSVAKKYGSVSEYMEHAKKGDLVLVGKNEDVLKYASDSYLDKFVEIDKDGEAIFKQFGRKGLISYPNHYSVILVNRKYEDGGALDLLADTSGAGLQNVGGSSFSNVDLTPQMDITHPMFANGGETHRSEGGMYAKGGRTSKDWTGRKKKEQWGKYDLSEMYENNLDLIADVVDYIKDLQKENGSSYAKDFVYEMMDVLKEGKITYNDGATLTFAKGGRTM